MFINSTAMLSLSYGYAYFPAFDGAGARPRSFTSVLPVATPSEFSPVSPAALNLSLRMVGVFC